MNKLRATSGVSADGLGYCHAFYHLESYLRELEEVPGFAVDCFLLTITDVSDVSFRLVNEKIFAGRVPPNR